MAAASLRALLAHSIDYAGLFPPANLTLAPALQNQAEYVRTTEAWMLGAFILPVGEFDAAARGLPQFDPQHPLQVSALGPRTTETTAFLTSISAMAESIVLFRKADEGRARLEQIEMPLPPDVDGDVMKKARAALADLDVNVFWEASAAAASETIALLASHNSSSAGRTFGFKLRTGGITSDAFPSSAQIAAALFATGKHKVPIKFTAGLHHPIRLFHASVQTKMHGFLNVLGAGVLAIEHSWPEEQIARMLDDEDPASFVFDGDYFYWREWKIATGRIEVHRRLVTSLGSCSFDEPREDLRALKLL